MSYFTRISFSNFPRSIEQLRFRSLLFCYARSYSGTKRVSCLDGSTKTEPSGPMILNSKTEKSMVRQRSLRRRAGWLDTERRCALERAALFAEQWELRASDFIFNDVTHLIADCGKMNSIQGMRAAQDVLDRLRVEQRRLAKLDEGGFFLGRKVWQTYIFGWACMASKFPQVSQSHIKDALELMEEDAKNEQGSVIPGVQKSNQKFDDQHQWNPDDKPTVEVYNTALQGYVNASRSSNSAPIEAYKLLLHMTELHRTSGWRYTKPNTRSYTLVLSAFANSGHNGYGGRALGVLRLMTQAQQRDQRLYQDEFNKPFLYDSPHLNERDIVTADTVAYTITLNALVRSKEDPKLIMKLLLEMQDCGQKTNRSSVDPVLLSAALGVYRNKMTSSESEKDRFRIGQEVDQILHRFQALSLDQSPDQMRVLYNTVMHIWSISVHPDSPRRCEQILEEMKHAGVEPDTTSLNCCLHAWKVSSNRHSDSWERAVALLSSFEDEGHAVNAQSYAITILTLAGNKGNMTRFKKARHLLERYVSHSRSHESRNLASPFTAVLIVCATGQTFHVRQKLEREKNSSFGADESLFDDPFKIASRTFQDLQRDIFCIGARCDHHAYSAYIKCLHRFCSDTSIELRTKTQGTFQDAKNDGQVSRLVITALKRIPNWRQIVGIDKDVRAARDLPSFWCRNVDTKWH